MKKIVGIMNRRVGIARGALGGRIFIRIALVGIGVCSGGGWLWLGSLWA
jgi:hypothetical protein